MDFRYNKADFVHRKPIMQIQPYQADIAERMLIGTTGETIHPDAQFVHTENGYWIAWHDQTAALLAPDTPPGAEIGRASCRERV